MFKAGRRRSPIRRSGARTFLDHQEQGAEQKASTSFVVPSLKVEKWQLSRTFFGKNTTKSFLENVSLASTTPSCFAIALAVP